VLTVTAALQMQYVSSGHAVKQTHCEIHYWVGFLLNACGEFDHDVPLKGCWLLATSTDTALLVRNSTLFRAASAFTNTAGDYSK